MKGVDFNEIGIFIKVIQARSFTLAAKQLGIPISTASARVASLEKRLGVTLVQRTTRQLKLTQAGKDYFDNCLKGIDEILKAENDVSQDQAEPQGLLRVSAPVFFGSCLLPEILLEMTQNFPKIKIELILTDHSVDLISEGIDLAIRAGSLKDSSLIAKKIGDVHFYPFASKSYIKKNGSPKHPKDLVNHSCIQFAPLGKEEWIFISSKGRVKVPLKGNLIIDELNIVESLVQSHQGIALLPNFICKLDGRKEDLVQILHEWRVGSRPVYFVYPPQRFLSPKTKIFMDIANEKIKSKL